MTAEPDALRLVPVPYAVLSEAAGLLDCEGYGSLALTLNNYLSAAPAPQEGEREALALSDLQTIKGWLHGLATAPDLTDVVADGGVSVGDCYQQEAREFAGRLDRAILALCRPAAPAPVAGRDEAVRTLQTIIHNSAGCVPGRAELEKCLDAILAALTAGAKPRATEAGEGVNRECKACGAFKPDPNSACGFCGEALRPAAPDADKPRDGEAVAWPDRLPSDLSDQMAHAWAMADDDAPQAVFDVLNRHYTHPPKPDARLSVAVRSLLDLPEVQKRREALRKGIGTSTDEGRAILSAETALRQIEGG